MSRVFSTRPTISGGGGGGRSDGRNSRPIPRTSGSFRDESSPFGMSFPSVASASSTSPQRLQLDITIRDSTGNEVGRSGPIPVPSIPFRMPPSFPIRSEGQEIKEPTAHGQPQIEEEEDLFEEREYDDSGKVVEERQVVHRHILVPESDVSQRLGTTIIDEAEEDERSTRPLPLSSTRSMTTPPSLSSRESRRSTLYSTDESRGPRRTSITLSDVRTRSRDNRNQNQDMEEQEPPDDDDYNNDDRDSRFVSASVPSIRSVRSTSSISARPKAPVDSGDRYPRIAEPPNPRIPDVPGTRDILEHEVIVDAKGIDRGQYLERRLYSDGRTDISKIARVPPELESARFVIPSDKDFPSTFVLVGKQVAKKLIKLHADDLGILDMQSRMARSAVKTNNKDQPSYDSKKVPNVITAKNYGVFAAKFVQDFSDYHVAIILNAVTELKRIYLKRNLSLPLPRYIYLINSPQLREEGLQQSALHACGYIRSRSEESIIANAGTATSPSTGDSDCTTFMYRLRADQWNSRGERAIIVIGTDLYEQYIMNSVMVSNPSENKQRYEEDMVQWNLSAELFNVALGEDVYLFNDVLKITRQWSMLESEDVYQYQKRIGTRVVGGRPTVTSASDDTGRPGVSRIQLLPQIPVIYEDPVIDRLRMWRRDLPPYLVMCEVSDVISTTDPYATLPKTQTYILVSLATEPKIDPSVVTTAGGTSSLPGYSVPSQTFLSAETLKVEMGPNSSIVPRDLVKVFEETSIDPQSGSTYTVIRIPPQAPSWIQPRLYLVPGRYQETREGTRFVIPVGAIPIPMIRDDPRLVRLIGDPTWNLQIMWSSLTRLPDFDPESVQVYNPSPGHEDNPQYMWRYFSWLVSQQIKQSARSRSMYGTHPDNIDKNRPIPSRRPVPTPLYTEPASDDDRSRKSQTKRSRRSLSLSNVQPLGSVVVSNRASRSGVISSSIDEMGRDASGDGLSHSSSRHRRVVVRR